MKHLFSFFLIASCVVLGGCTPSSLTDSHTDSGPDVVTYNDTIVGHLVAMDAIYEDYSTYAEQTSLEYVAKIEEKLEQSLTRIKEKQTTLNYIGGYKGDTSLLDAANTYAVGLIALLDDADKERGLVNVWKELHTQDTPISDQQKTQQKTYNANIRQQRKAINHAFFSSQQAFARTHNYRFKESPTTGNAQKHE